MCFTTFSTESKGATLTVRMNAIRANYPQDLRLCLYEYDPTNTIKNFSNSCMGELIDYAVITEAVPTSVNGHQYADFTFDISSYLEKVVASEESTFSVIFWFDKTQLEGYADAKVAGTYTGTTTNLSFLIYPNSKYMHNSTSAVFGGGQPRLTYYKFAE